ncbi:MAG: hypothetical protein HY700_17965 [Gemmatimonadetes bacterium]|nr:hypothetical protein [Gemmatimonadota bacterium]
MTQPRMSAGRSSLAIALNQYYTGPRPGIALTISAVALIAAVAIGVAHVVMLGQSGMAIADGQRTMRTLHKYNAALEVWRQMAVIPEKDVQFPAQKRLRDSIATALRNDIQTLQSQTTDATNARLLGSVLTDLQSGGAEKTPALDLGANGRAAMIVLAAREDSALFRAAQKYQRSQFFAALLIGLTVIASASLIFPMAWAYVRFKRGIPPGV